MTAQAKTQAKTQALTKKQTTALSTEGSWGADEVDASDILVHKIIVTQSNSKSVLAKEAQAGDIVKFPGNEVIGGAGKPISFVPFKSFKTWNIFQGKENPKWDRSEPFNVSNATRELVWTEEGVTYTAEKVLNFFCVLIGEAFLPIILPFSKSGYRVGQDLVNHGLQMRDLNRPLANNIWQMNTKLVSFNNNNWYAPVLLKGEVTPNDTLQEARKWFNTLTPENVRQEHEEDSVEETQPQF